MRTHVLEAPTDGPFGFSLAVVHRRTALIPEVETDEDTVGFGECYGP